MKSVEEIKKDFYESLTEAEVLEEYGTPNVGLSIFLKNKLAVLSDVLENEISMEDIERVKELTTWDEFESTVQALPGKTMGKCLHDTKEFSKVIPDSSITNADMLKYGYVWEGMLPIRAQNAEKLYEAGLEVFVLYPDNTESSVESKNDITQHAVSGMIFGVEKEMWNKFLETNGEETEQVVEQGM